jgi:hypothetical protein
MVRKRELRVVTDLVAALPELPWPWRIEELCARVARQRRRPLLLHAMDLPALPFGLWFDDGATDHIIYRVGVTGFHRDHIVLHELCHLLAGHNRVDLGGDTAVTTADPVARLIGLAMDSTHTNEQEDIAETFASRALRLANQGSAAPVTEFEQRAAAMFGVA